MKSPKFSIKSRRGTFNEDYQMELSKVGNKALSFIEEKSEQWKTPMSTLHIPMCPKIESSYFDEKAGMRSGNSSSFRVLSKKQAVEQKDYQEGSSRNLSNYFNLRSNSQRICKPIAHSPQDLFLKNIYFPQVAMSNGISASDLNFKQRLLMNPQLMAISLRRGSKELRHLNKYLHLEQRKQKSTFSCTQLKNHTPKKSTPRKRKLNFTDATAKYIKNTRTDIVTPSEYMQSKQQPDDIALMQRNEQSISNNDSIESEPMLESSTSQKQLDLEVSEIIYQQSVVLDATNSPLSATDQIN